MSGRGGMKNALIRLVPVAALVLLVVAGAALQAQKATSSSPVGSTILAHKLAVELGKESARGKEMPVSSGIMYTLLQGKGVLDKRAAKASGGSGNMSGLDENNGISDNNTEGCQNVFHGHGQT